MEVYRVSAPAKINIRLKLEGRRPDGYHLLSMLNFSCSLCDELLVQVEEGHGIALEISGGIPVPGGSENLIVKAVLALLPEGFNRRLRIQLNKRIPVGGGLGGGSSDAAATIRVLQFARLVPSDRATIDPIAVRLGADVPFCLSGEPARVFGIGDKFEPLDAESVLGRSVVLVFPNESISTARVFQLVKESSAEFERDDLLRSVGCVTWDRLAELAENDLEQVVRSHFSVTSAALDLLRSLSGVRTVMSGSGSTLIVLPKDGEQLEAEAVCEHIRSLGLAADAVTLCGSYAGRPSRIG